MTCRFESSSSYTTRRFRFIFVVVWTLDDITVCCLMPKVILLQYLKQQVVYVKFTNELT